ncbi:MAG: L-lactate dehydrogenase [bacterium]
MPLATKVGIVGVGHVGATIAYATILEELATEIVLIDQDERKAEGEMFDLNHGIAFSRNVALKVGNYADLADANIIIIAAGVSRKENQSRIDLIKINYEILTDLIKKITQHNKAAILLIVSNPVDILTYAAYRISGYPWHRVIGSGTKLDSSRFRFFLSQKLNISPQSVNAYIIGEHGEHAVPVWSRAFIGGQLITEHKTFTTKEKEEVESDVKKAGMSVIKRKQVTNYAIASSVTNILRAIIKNEKSIHTVSSCLNGFLGIHNISLSLPCVLGRAGIHEQIHLGLSSIEEIAFKAGATAQLEILKAINLA